MKAYIQLFPAVAAKALNGRVVSSRKRSFDPQSARYEFRVSRTPGSVRGVLGNRYSYRDRGYIPVGQRPAGRKRLVAFLAVIVKLLSLAAAWRWTPLQDWLSPQRAADFITRFSSPGGRALVAVAGVGWQAS